MATETSKKKTTTRKRTLQSKKQMKSRSVSITEDADDSKKIAALRVSRRKLKSLKAHPKNPRKHPKKGTDEYEALRTSLADEYFDPLIVNDRNGMLVSGHLRKKIMTAEGIIEADVVVVDVDEQKHVARMIAANHGSGEYDYPRLSDVLEELHDDEGFEIRLTGMTIATIDSLRFREEHEVDNEEEEWNDADLPDFESGEKDIKLIIYFSSEEERQQFVADHDVTITKKQNGQWIHREEEQDEEEDDDEIES